MNDRVVSEVIKTLDKGSLQGKTVSVIGAFTVRTFNLVNIDMRKIMIVPIKIESVG